jgi:shikimate dehydrogenase
MKDTDQDRPEKTLPEPPPLPPEVGGAPGPEPTRYGDWQHKGRCTHF